MVEGNEGLQRKAAAVLTYYGTELRALPSSIAAELVRIVAGKVGVKE